MKRLLIVMLLICTPCFAGTNTELIKQWIANATEEEITAMPFSANLEAMAKQWQAKNAPEAFRAAQIKDLESTIATKQSQLADLKAVEAPK